MRRALDGSWTYRSFVNRAALVEGDAAAALALIFGEGVIKFAEEADGVLRGGLAMGEGYALTLSGTWSDEAGTSFACTGLGIDDTPTEGWQYDYRGSLAPHFEQAMDEVDCLLGTVLRAKPHGPGAPAGVTASFIAVRRPAALLGTQRARRPSFAP